MYNEDQEDASEGTWRLLIIYQHKFITMVKNSFMQHEDRTYIYS